MNVDSVKRVQRYDETKLAWNVFCEGRAQHDRIAWRLGGWDLIQALQSLLPEWDRTVECSRNNNVISTY